MIDIHTRANKFIDSFFLMFLPYILHSIRVTGYLQTIIDNTFSNYVFKEVVCGNVTSTQFDHLPQDLFIPSVFSDNAATNSNIFARSWTNFNQAEVVVDYFD